MFPPPDEIPGIFQPGEGAVKKIVTWMALGVFGFVILLTCVATGALVLRLVF